MKSAEDFKRDEVFIVKKMATLEYTEIIGVFASREAADTYVLSCGYVKCGNHYKNHLLRQTAWVENYPVFSGETENNENKEEF